LPGLTGCATSGDRAAVSPCRRWEVVPGLVEVEVAVPRLTPALR
jgi:hypothetical protein